MHVFMLHSKGASLRESPMPNLTRNPLQHLAEKFPIDKLT